MLALGVLLALLGVVVSENCTSQGSPGRKCSTNLSVQVWSTFPPSNSYRHFDHLKKLSTAANSFVATNAALFGKGRSSPDYLERGSPMRALLGIPVEEPAYAYWSFTSLGDVLVTIQSSQTDQLFGRIRVDARTLAVVAAHDVKALCILSEMNRRLCGIVGSRETALRLFKEGTVDRTSPEQDAVIKALARAIFMPPEQKYYITMSAPGGSNRGVGRLLVGILSEANSLEHVAAITYPMDETLLSVLGFARPHYKFGGLRLEPAWTNLNTAGLLLDGEGIPYPRRSEE